MLPVIDAELRLRLSATEAYLPSVADDMGNPPWDTAAGRILVLRLSPFNDIEASTAHLVLFEECRRALREAYIDFGFFPGRRDRAILSARNLPFFYGLESGRGPADFDLVLVSNAFALELVNLSYLFSTAGIPRRASERAAKAATDGQVPIVIAGGSNAPAAGALLFPGGKQEESSDCLVDGIFFGEGELAIGELAAALTFPGATREERLERSSTIEGFWRALSGKTASRKILRPYPPSLLRYPILNSEGAGTARLQISAGCPGFCSFCLEGWESRPYRELPMARIVEAARALKASTGAVCLEVYSYNFNMHSEILELIFELSRIFRRVNFMSQRLDLLAESPALVEAELAADKRSYTLGIEGISERMRNYYRKGIEERQIYAAIARLALPAVREIKLFYIIAGFEDEKDIAEFADFAHQIAQTRRLAAPSQRIIVSAGYLARLPFTPLQFAPLCLDREKLETVADRIESACVAAGLEFRLAVDFEEHYVDQLLALGGSALAPWLENTCRSGIHYDTRLSTGTGADLEAFAASLGPGQLDEAFLGEKGEEWHPPLAFIDGNLDALRKNYILASRFAPKEWLSPVAPHRAPDFQPKLERLMDAKRHFASIFIRIAMPRFLARATAEYRSAWILRTIFAASPTAVATVFDAQEELFSKGGSLEGFANLFWGLSCCRLLGPDAKRLAEAARETGFEILDGIPVPARIEVELEIHEAFAREAEETLKAWLFDERISFVERHTARARLLECAPRDLKKKILFGAQLIGPESSESGSFEVRLSLGPKARIPSWLSRLSYPASRSVSLRILSIESR